MQMAAALQSLRRWYSRVVNEWKESARGRRRALFVQTRILLHLVRRCSSQTFQPDNTQPPDTSDQTDVTSCSTDSLRHFDLPTFNLHTFDRVHSVTLSLFTYFNLIIWSNKFKTIHWVLFYIIWNNVSLGGNMNAYKHQQLQYISESKFLLFSLLHFEILLVLHQSHFIKKCVGFNKRIRSKLQPCDSGSDGNSGRRAKHSTPGPI